MAARTKSTQTRQRLACEAARLMADQSHPDHDLARRKAAARLGVANKRLWPSNAEVDEALQQQLRLFRPQQGGQLRLMRERALDAMRALRSFRPRLVGPVLTGSADMGSPVRLYLFAQVPDDVVLALLAQGIPWDQRDRNLPYPGGCRRRHPVLEFVAGGIRIELVVLPAEGRAGLPLDPVTERPERGVGIADLEVLLEAECAPRAQR